MKNFKKVAKTSTAIKVPVFGNLLVIRGFEDISWPEDKNLAELQSLHD